MTDAEYDQLVETARALLRPDGTHPDPEHKPEILGCRRRSCGQGVHSLVWGDCALAEQPPPETRLPIFRKYIADDGLPAMAMDYTHLHWGETVGTDTSQTGREVSLPVCDDAGRELGDIRLSYTDAAVLGAMLTDAAAREADPT